MFGRRRVPKAWTEAASWHARMAEPASPHEVAEFEEWLARDPLNARSYAEMEAVMAATGALPRQVGAVRRPASVMLRPALAFGLAAVALVTGVMLWQSTSAPAFATISNSGSAIRGVRLEDGTRVWLDVGAQIGVRLSDGRREILVREGRVRVVPAADPRPLEIGSGGTRVAPGLTRIDVTVGGGRVTFGAVDGPLLIAGASRADRQARLPLEAGRALALEADGLRSVPLERAWTVGRLRFADAPLRSILPLANRLGDPDIVAPDLEVAALRVSGVFDLRDTRRLARKLAATLDLRVEDDGSRLILRR